ncbi:MAG: WGR domain-containing protein [Myxococcaceae bacterium]
MSAKRYFEFSEGTSNKFWEVWIEGNQVYTRYGKIGSNGQMTVKDEGGADKAQKLYDKLIKEKTGKGYQEKGGGGGAAAPAAEAPKKEAAKKEEKAPAKKEEKKAAAAPPPPAAAGGTRRFEFSEGGSNKFWEITVDGNSHTVRYGKIGTPGQEKAKSFGSPAAAQSDADKLIKEKTGKGYAEVAAAGGGGGGPEAPPLDPKQLGTQFAAIDKAPEKPDAYLVFADWLEGQGHPWGKLISLQHAVATAPNAKKKSELEREVTALLQSQGHAILKDLARAGRPTNFDWHYGFVTHATLASPTDKVVLKERLETFFDLPVSRATKKLTLHAQPARLQTRRDWDDSEENVVNPWAGVAGALSKAPKTLKALSFGEPPPTGAAAYVAMPPLAEFAKALPELEELELQGTGGGVGANGLSGKWGFPELKSLEVRAAAPSADDLSNIAAAKLPKLEHLTVWLGGTTYTDLDSAGYDPYDNEDGEARYPEFFPASDLEACEVYDISQAVNAQAVGNFLKEKFPKVTHLGLKSGVLNPEMLEAIINSPLVKQVKKLDLGGGTMNDAGADVLIANKAKLAHLESLRLDGNRLTPEGIAKLTKALPNVNAGKQRGSGDPEFFFRYVATME